MYQRLVIALACLATLLVSSPARAWMENHVKSSDVHLEIDAKGMALVEHRLALKTNGNERLKTYTLVGIDDDAKFEASYVVPAKDALSNSLETAIAVTAEVTPETRLPGQLPERAGRAAAKLTIDDKRGLARGNYVFVLRYRTDLKKRALIDRDGSLVRITWFGPRLEDGLDKARVTFAIPTAATPPRALSDEDWAPSAEVEDDQLRPTYLSELRRGDDFDELELMRTYAPAHEPVAWQIRVDRRAVAGPQGSAKPIDDSEGTTAIKRWRPPLPALWAAGFLIVLGFMAWEKQVQVKNHSESRGALPRPIVPLPRWTRVTVGPLAIVAGLGCQLLWSAPRLGATLVVVGGLLIGFKSSRPDPKAKKRGPGKWLSVRPLEVFGRQPGPRRAFLDSSSRWGKLWLVLAVAATLGGGYWLSQQHRTEGLLVACNAVVWLFIFGTGRRRAMPGDGVADAAPTLKRAMKLLNKRWAKAKLRISPRIRIPRDSADADELRLFVSPAIPARGFSSIELGVVFALGSGVRIALPEVLVRVTADSPAHEAMRALRRAGPNMPGRKPNEIVYRLTPRLPTSRMTAVLIAALAARLSRSEQEIERPTAVEKPSQLAA